MVAKGSLLGTYGKCNECDCVDWLHAQPPYSHRPVLLCAECSEELAALEADEVSESDWAKPIHIGIIVSILLTVTICTLIISLSILAR